MSHAVALAPPLRVSAIASLVTVVVAAWTLMVVVPAQHGVAAFALTWLAMSVAMMVPTVTRPLRRAADGSGFRAWQFVAGYIVLWMVAGVPAYALMNSITWTSAWIAFVWMIAGAYQLTPMMRRNLTDCRSVRYDGRPVGYGMRQGVRCVVSCGPVMVAVMVTMMALPSLLPAMLVLVAVTVVICWEKRPSTAARTVAAVGLGILLLAAGGFVLLGGHGGSMNHVMGTSTS